MGVPPRQPLNPSTAPAQRSVLGARTVGNCPAVTGGERKGPRWIAAGVLWAAPLFGLWLALTDNTRPLELIVGAACALLAGAGAEAAGLAGRVHFRPRARWLARLVALPWWIAR